MSQVLQNTSSGHQLTQEPLTVWGSPRFALVVRENQSNGQQPVKAIGEVHTQELKAAAWWPQLRIFLEGAVHSLLQHDMSPREGNFSLLVRALGSPHQKTTVVASFWDDGQGRVQQLMFQHRKGATACQGVQHVHEV